MKYGLVDWGTSNLRLWLIGEDGGVAYKAEDPRGMSALKPEAFEGVLESLLEAAERALHAQSFASLPVVICGMAGAKSGWHEAAYLPIPASLNALAEKAANFTSGGRNVYILPGAACLQAERPDVMRGEETQMWGAVLSGYDTAQFCLPGTHCKWAKLEGGILTRFRTVFTGELFALLSKQSTLIGHDEVWQDTDACDQAFAVAVKHAFANPQTMISDIFSVRSTPLTQGPQPSGCMQARLSGLLIGAEIGAMRGVDLDDRSGPIVLISSGKLGALYSRAFTVLDLEIQQVDAENMTLAGLRQAAEMLLG